MRKVSVVIPLYNGEEFISDVINSVLNQSYDDYEIIIVDDGSSDQGVHLARKFSDDRIQIVQQENRGLAGARNTGILYAKGEYVALLDADDLWDKDKLKHHVDHLDRNTDVGVSYSQSHLMDDNKQPLGIIQKPQLDSITAVTILCRNPIGNGSAPVIRKKVFDEIMVTKKINGVNRNCYFDEEFRQSEDIECWIRIALMTQWKFEGIGLPLTWYRVNSNGLSADVDKQLESWEKVINKIDCYSSGFEKKYVKMAKAYQYRYLARRAIRSRDAITAVRLVNKAITTDISILSNEPGKTMVTFVCAYLLYVLPNKLYGLIEMQAINFSLRQQQTC